jgi:hypothetical protein
VIRATPSANSVRTLSVIAVSPSLLLYRTRACVAVDQSARTWGVLLRCCGENLGGVAACSPRRRRRA